MKYYEKNFNLKLILQLAIVFFVGFVIARNNLIVGSIGSSFDSPYVNFYTEIIRDRFTDSLPSPVGNRTGENIIMRTFYICMFKPINS